MSYRKNVADLTKIKEPGLTRIGLAAKDRQAYMDAVYGPQGLCKKLGLHVPTAAGNGVDYPDAASWSAEVGRQGSRQSQSAQLSHDPRNARMNSRAAPPRAGGRIGGRPQVAGQQPRDRSGSVSQGGIPPDQMEVSTRPGGGWSRSAEICPNAVVVVGEGCHRTKKRKADNQTTAHVLHTHPTARGPIACCVTLS